MLKRVLIATLTIVMIASSFTGCDSKTAQGTTGKNTENNKTNSVNKAIAKVTEKKGVIGNTNALYALNAPAAKSGDWIYFNWVSGLCKSKEDGSELTKLDSLYTKYISVVGDWIYFLGEKNGQESKYCAYRIKTDGTCKEQLTYEGITRLFVVDDYIYYQDIFDDQDIKRKSVTAKKDEAGKSIAHIKYSIANVSLVGDWIYYITAVNPTNDNNKPNNYEVHRVKLDGTADEQVMDVTEYKETSSSEDKSILTTDGKIAYIIGQSKEKDYTVVILDLSKKEAIEKIKIDGSYNFTIDENGYLYSEKYENGSYAIIRSKPGSESNIQVVIDSFISDYIVVGNYLYFTNKNHLDKRCKISKDGVGPIENNPIQTR